MGIKAILASATASFIGRSVARKRSNPILDQAQIFLKLIKKAADTRFGHDHDFASITKYSDFVERVPLREYEEFSTYIALIKQGESDILWPGKPKYLAKTSGTTSGIKYIPLTKESMPSHFNTARDAAFNYIYKTGNTAFFDGKLLYLSGSPELDNTGPIPTGRLSGISNHEVPAIFRRSQLPSYTVNCIEDWEEKVDAIISESLDEDIRMISGIPSWVKMYIERVLQKTGKQRLMEVYPNLSLYIYGGVNYEPYRSSIEKLIGKQIDTVELFPASEGFFAFQDEPTLSSMLLNTNSGMFFEFVSPEFIHLSTPPRLNINTIEKDKPYVLIVSSNAGLWAYNTGDIVTFTSLRPYRLVFSGRSSHFISAFGEHVIGKEVEDSMKQALQAFDAEISEFTVAPQVNPPEGGLPYHEWLIEFSKRPEDMKAFEEYLDNEMTAKNIYYKDLISGGILRKLIIKELPPNSFSQMMKQNGKLGGQNKVPRLTNDRNLADQLVNIKKENAQ